MPMFLKRKITQEAGVSVDSAGIAPATFPLRTGARP